VPLTIRTAAGQAAHFTVEVARTPEEQAARADEPASLAPDRGMIFPHEPPRMASFWMKNTLIPLDIIFVRPTARSSTSPRIRCRLSLDPVPSLEPVGAVLELAGGRTAELGIKAGDKVEWVRSRRRSSACSCPPGPARGSPHGIFGEHLHLVERRDLGTSLFTRRHGREVGRDELGNVYFEHRKDPAPPLGDLQRRQRRQPDAAAVAELASRADRRRAGQGAAAAPQVREAGGAEPDGHG
jgi:uncharacterized membrane protein (UPF0127 family)